MLFNYSIPGQVSISMGNMITEFLAEVGVGDDARAESPVSRQPTTCSTSMMMQNY